MINELIPMDQEYCKLFCKLNQYCQHNMDYECKQVFDYFYTLEQQQDMWRDY